MFPLIDAVYPRWRGEHYNSATGTASSGGLSPLARGTRRVPAQELTLSRFIPAGAGNTLSSLVALSNNTVYPRWRGEHDKTKYQLQL